MKTHAEMVALVTGAYRGIGLEVARQLAGRGYTVVLNALTRMLADELRGARVLVNSVCPGWAATLLDGGPNGGFFRDGEPLAW